MKKILVVLMFTVFSLNANALTAVGLCALNACPSFGYTNISGSNCATTDTAECYGSNGSGYGEVRITSCATCPSGYTRTARTGTTTTSLCNYTYYTCVSDSATVSCSATTYSSSTCGTSFANTISNCASYTSYCFGGVRVRTCNTCNDGYDKVTSTLSVDGCSNTYSYSTCLSGVVSADECDSDSDCGFGGIWATTNTKYQKRTTYTCKNPDSLVSTCASTTEYQCAPGYYGAPTGTFSGCTECPEHEASGTVGTSGLSSYTGGATTIDECYISASTTWDFTDTTGDGTENFQSDCYYTE